MPRLFLPKCERHQRRSDREADTASPTRGALLGDVDGEKLADARRWATSTTKLISGHLVGS